MQTSDVHRVTVLDVYKRQGLEERYQPVTEELKSRLDYELSTIKNMGYVDSVSYTHLDVYKRQVPGCIPGRRRCCRLDGTGWKRNCHKMCIRDRQNE